MLSQASRLSCEPFFQSFVLLSLFRLISPVASAAIKPPIDLSTSIGRSQTGSRDAYTVVNETHYPSHCTKSPNWSLPQRNPGDCIFAITHMTSTEFPAAGYSTEYEFLSRGASPIYPLVAMQTPRKYTYGQQIGVLPMLYNSMNVLMNILNQDHALWQL